MSNWQPIETAPLDKTLLLWWTPINQNKYAESPVIGAVSSYEPGKWWDAMRGEYKNLSHITHWMPLPAGPEDK